VRYVTALPDASAHVDSGTASARQVIAVTARAGELAERLSSAMEARHISADEMHAARAQVADLMLRVEAAAETALDPLAVASPARTPMSQRSDQANPTYHI
jgi:Cdc6-like AAA superfamily ATPase